MSKQRGDEDSQADMEVGMTTAERRRRRRRGGGLRVPSDNVPRSRTPTAPPAPVPEDPALAMSIAYSFTNDASGPVSRVDASGPIAPDAMATVIDPPAIEQQDFDMKTREMSAVDLEALGLAEAGTTMKMERVSSPGIEGAIAPLLKDPRVTTDRTVEVDVDVLVDDVVTDRRPTLDAVDKSEPKKKITTPPPINRLQTVALSEEDLEEVRASTAPTTRLPTMPSASPPAPPVTPKPPTLPPPITARETEKPITTPPKTVPATTKGTIDEPMSVPDIDIQELADRAEQSGEIEVSIDETEPDKPEPKSMRAQTAPPVPPQESRTKSGAIEPLPHPPPPPVGHQKPPAPPPTAKKSPPPAAVAAAVTREPSRPARSKPWFADLFDEDYLRTLPFLTPQATQAEAEFVIDTMQLAPGVQVLDVGCGYGRHAMELAARGFHVVGLDLSTPLLVRGGEEAHRRGLTINFIRGDMRELDFENQFDAAYCLFSTFGYFDDETNKKTLQNIARALKPGGKILVEILNRDYVIADLPTRVWWEGEGCVVLEEVELNYFSSRIQVNRSVVFDDGRQLEQEISVRAYSLHEVGKLMHAAGFRVLEVSGGYQTRGRFFGNQSRHIIVLAERKETPGA